MTFRKDLLFSVVIGAMLAGAGCLLLTPRTTSPVVSRRETIAKNYSPVWETVPSVSSPRSHVLPLENQPPPALIPAPGVTPHPAKPVTAFRKPELLPVSKPFVQAVASSPPDTPMKAENVPVPPVPQNSDNSTLAQVITPQAARAALGKVGTDPEAEAVWIAAINDANMPANQRKDLIEDLNEEGFTNPKKLTAADLPRIEKRIALIEELAPEAIDQTNADAFQEAYKDLKNMQSRLNKP